MTKYFTMWAKHVQLSYTENMFNHIASKYAIIYTPVGAPWDGGDQANVRKKDGVIFDAIQGVVHLTQWQSVQLELQLHLTVRPERVSVLSLAWLSHRLWVHNTKSSIQNTTDHILYLKV